MSLLYSVIEGNFIFKSNLLPFIYKVALKGRAAIRSMLLKIVIFVFPYNGRKHRTDF